MGYSPWGCRVQHDLVTKRSSTSANSHQMVPFPEFGNPEPFKLAGWEPEPWGCRCGTGGTLRLRTA